MDSRKIDKFLIYLEFFAYRELFIYLFCTNCFLPHNKNYSSFTSGSVLFSFLRFISDAILFAITFRGRSYIGVVAICRAGLFSKSASFGSFAALPSSLLKRFQRDFLFARMNIGIACFSTSVSFHCTRFFITLDIWRLGFYVFDVVLFLRY